MRLLQAALVSVFLLLLLVSCQQSSQQPIQQALQQSIGIGSNLTRDQAATLIQSKYPTSVPCKPPQARLHLNDDGTPVRTPEELGWRDVAVLYKHGYYTLQRDPSMPEMGEYVFTNKGRPGGVQIPVNYRVTVTGVSQEGNDAKVIYQYTKTVGLIDGNQEVTNALIGGNHCSPGAYSVDNTGTETAYLRKYDDGWRIER